MTAPDYPDGTPCWIELFTTDPDGAADFYRDLFGWDQVTTEEEFGGYRNFLLGDSMMAGCMKNTTPEAVPNVWVVYLASSDAAATVEAARALGMHVAVEEMPVGGLGTMAMVSDPGGAMVGIWQSADHLGMGAIGEPDTPGWFELHTKDYDAVVTVRVDGTERKFALEYERTPKTRKDYLRISSEIDGEKLVDRFLYLAPSHDMLSFLVRSFEGSRRAIYFGLLRDFLDSRLDAPLRTVRPGAIVTLEDVLRTR